MRTVSAAETALPPILGGPMPTDCGCALAGTWPWTGLALALGNQACMACSAERPGKTTPDRTLATVLKPAGGRLTLLASRWTPRRPAAGASGAGLPAAAVRVLPRFTVRDFVRVHGVAQGDAERPPSGGGAAGDRPGLSRQGRYAHEDALRRECCEENRPARIVNDPAVLPARRAHRPASTGGSASTSASCCATIGVDRLCPGLHPSREDVVAACTDVVIINEGRLVHQGTPDDLVAAGWRGRRRRHPAERGYFRAAAPPPAGASR